VNVSNKKESKIKKKIVRENTSAYKCHFKLFILIIKKICGITKLEGFTHERERER
jgi:hypothetical protein